MPGETFPSAPNARAPHRAGATTHDGPTAGATVVGEGTAVTVAVAVNLAVTVTVGVGAAASPDLVAALAVGPRLDRGIGHVNKRTPTWPTSTTHQWCTWAWFCPGRTTD